MQRSRRTSFYLPETAGQVFDGRIDYVIDAVDTVTAKLDIVMRAKQSGIPVISSMGMGNKLDPTKIVITDISKTSTIPLAKVMRKELRTRGITSLSGILTGSAGGAGIQERAGGGRYAHARNAG